MTEEQLRLLGLGMRAGRVIVGTGGVRAALQRGELDLVVVAADHSPRTAEKVVRLARAMGIETLEGPPASQLGRRLGRSSVQSVGVRDRQLTAGILGGQVAKHARRA
jgi:ribosomal protein L7Ae-like RNA K-turn-binding protein